MDVVVVVVVVALVVAAGVLVISAARRRDLGIAAGELSRQTRKRDRGMPAQLAEEPGAPSGRDVERAAAQRRRAGTAVEPARPAAPIAYTPPDPERIGITRRQFFNRSIVTLMGLSIAGFGLAVLGFLWPQAGEGFGAAIRVGRLSDVRDGIAAGNGFLYRPDGRMWITEYPDSALERAREAYSPAELAGMEQGVVALYQKCPHLGCRVPECVTSQWFECGCHGSFYNRVGEKRAGPAPRGMDRFAMSFDGDVLVVDTGTIIQGPPIGTNTTRQEPAGPHCVGEGSE